jgi:two-component system CheB/CheR fusion protein
LNGAIVRWNAGAQETYGYTREQAVGRNIHKLLRGNVDTRPFMTALQNDGRWSGELAHTGSGGREVVVESVMVLVREGRGSGIVFETNHAITERQHREQLLWDRAQDLAAADRSKNEFLAMLAHELRNPLAPLSNSVELLSAGSADETARGHARDVLQRQTRNIARMVDDLLDASRITQGTIVLQKERTDLATVIDHAVQASQHHFHARRQVLRRPSFSSPVYLFADPMRIEQVFVNLLNNASKYSNDGAHIEVKVDVRGGGANGAAEAVIEIVDDGIGIAPEFLPRVFDLFVQADRTLERSRGGLGIGLTLVRRLVELHGGTVTAHSDGLGHGTELIVRLPTTAEMPAAVPSTQHAGG